MRRIPILLLLAAAPIAARAETASTPQDRYGPPPAAAAARQTEAGQLAHSPDAPAPKTLLKWTGKDRPARIVAAAVATPAVAPAARPQAEAPVRYAVQPAVAQTPTRPQPTTQLLGGPPAPPTSPSIYSPPARMAAAPAPTTPSRGPRLYSVAREFGMQPDPTPVAVHNRDGTGMILTEVPTNDAPADEDLPLHRRVTNAAGQTQIVERPRAASTN